jgi:dTDP-4-dehydrorhamnose reductase
MVNEPKYLILGTSKNVGIQLFHALGSEKAVATYRSNPVSGGVYFDALSMNIGSVLDQYPTIASAAILYGETDPDKCFRDPQWSQALNVDSIKKVIDELRSRGIHILFMSSQFVFDGMEGDYSEDVAPNPILLYGRQKVEIETYLEKTSSNYVVLRLSKAVGDMPGDGTLFPNWIDSIIKGRSTIRCATDQKLSPILKADIVEAIVRAMDRKIQGVFHLSGPRGYRRIELLDMVLDELRKYMDVDIDVEQCSILDFDLPEKRPVDVSMRSDKLASAIGLKITDMETVCRRTVRRYFPDISNEGERGG